MIQTRDYSTPSRGFYISSNMNGLDLRWRGLNGSWIEPNYRYLLITTSVFHYIIVFLTVWNILELARIMRIFGVILSKRSVLGISLMYVFTLSVYACYIHTNNIIEVIQPSPMECQRNTPFSCFHYFLEPYPNFFH